MKKCITHRCRSLLWPKMNLSMRFSILFIFVAIFQIQANSYSQDVKITLHEKQISILDFFEKVETITPYSFLYRVGDIDLNRKIKNSLIYHGNMGPERGIVELIEAMSHVIKIIPDANLSLIGGFRTIEYKREVNSRIDMLRMRKHISLQDHILHREVWQYLAKHTLGIIPFNENPLTTINTPTKLFEFMVSGCQLVVPDLRAITKYDFKAAKIFKPGDVKNLSDSIINSLKNNDRDGIEYNVNKVRSDYNWENNSYKLIELYDRVLS